MGEHEITGNHDKSTNARVVTLKAVLVGRDEVAKMGEEIVDTLRVP